MSNHQDTCIALGIGIMANVPTLLWGPPGQGKTSVIEQISKDYQMPLETVIASVREPSDFAGLPVVDAATGTVRLAPPGWAQRLTDHGKGIVFYDEISTAPPAVQAALLRPILDNCVGDLQMPENIRTVAAANPPDMTAAGWDLTPPNANRFLHLDWKLDAEVVREGFTIGWPTVPLLNPDPTAASDAFREAKMLVGLFVAARPELLTKMPEEVTEASRAFPTPRSWEQAAKLYGFAKAAGANSNVVQMLLRGSVGTDATAQFMEFVQHLDLPDPEKLLADPNSFIVPSERGDKVYAIAASTWSALSSNPTPERWLAYGDILARLAQANHGDIAYVFGTRWAHLRAEYAIGMLPSASAMESLTPILVELKRLIQTA